MKEYKCKSKIVVGRPCEHNCVVKCDFEPRGCLKYGIAEEWEEVPVVKVGLTYDKRKPYVEIRANPPNGFWYSNCVGQMFNVLPVSYKGQVQDVEGFGNVDLSEMFIVSEGEHRGNIMFREHCFYSQLGN